MVMIPAGGTEADGIQPAALLDIALDAYTYAYPLLAMDTLRRIGTSVLKADCEHGRGAPINQFTHLRRLPDASSAERRPSVDTLRSSLWFDVSREPLVVTLPDWGERFYSLSLLDAWSDAFACLGARSTGAEAQRFAIVGPRWRRSLPRGIRLQAAHARLRSRCNAWYLLGIRRAEAVGTTVSLRPMLLRLERPGA